MPRQVISGANAPSSPLFSQGVTAGPFVFVSGIVGIDPSTGSLAGDTIQEQTRQALTNCEASVFNRTSAPATSPRFWKLRPTPSRARRWAGILVTSRPKACTVPSWGRSSPEATLKSVVLPAPLGPIRPVMRPWCTSIETPRSEWTPPNRMCACRTWSATSVT